MKPRTLQLSAVLLLFAVLISFPQPALAGWIESAMWSIVVGFFGLFVGLAGWLLNVGVTDYVVGFGTSFLETGVGVAVDTLWIAVRDIFNISFIFGLVFIGFKMILDSDDSGTRRWLVHLILAAILVNFSLYFTKFIVDFSNIMATQIANTFPTTSGIIDVSGAFMGSLGITSILKAPELTATGNGAWGYIFGTMILFIVMIFVFAAGGLMLLIRYVSLCLYMVLSPLMFIGWVFPQLQSYTDKYWREFLGKAFFAPIYLLLIYFSYYVVTAFVAGNRLKGKNPDFGKAISGDGVTVIDKFGETFPPFIIACIFLIASIVVASKLGADGANTAVSFGKDLTGRVKRYAKNTAQRTAVGAAMGASLPVRAGLRRGAYNLGNKLEQQINRAQTLQKSDGKIKSALGSLARTTIADDLVRNKATELQNRKYGMSRTFKDEEVKAAAIGSAAEASRNAAINASEREASQTKYLTNSALAGNANLTPEQQKEALKLRESTRSEVAVRVKKTTDEDLIKMDRSELLQIAEHLSDKQIEAIEKSGKFSTFGNDSDIKKIKEARAENTFKDYVADLDDASSSAEKLGDAIKGIASAVKGLSDERLTGMKAAQLSQPNIAMHLSNDQIRALRTSGKYSAEGLSDIEKARETGITRTITDGGVVNFAQNANHTANPASFDQFKEAQRENLFKRSVADVGSLPVSAFTQAAAYKYITPAMLESRIKNGVSNSEKESIEKALQTHLQGANTNTVNQWKNWQERSSAAFRFDLGQSTPTSETPKVEVAQGYSSTRPK